MKDISLTMKRNVFTNDIVTLDRRNAIKQKINNIFNLSPGDLVFKDYLYSNVKKLLGENVSNVNASIIKEYISLALDNYVGEVELMDAKITPDYDNQKYIIKLYYSIVDSNIVDNMQITLKTTN